MDFAVFIPAVWCLLLVLALLTLLTTFVAPLLTSTRARA